jgi:hypothetical protein
LPGALFLAPLLKWLSSRWLRCGIRNVTWRATDTWVKPGMNKNEQPPPGNAEESVSIFLQQLAGGNSPRRVEDIVLSAFDTFCRRAQAGISPTCGSRRFMALAGAHHGS